MTAKEPPGEPPHEAGGIEAGRRNRMRDHSSAARRAHQVQRYDPAGNPRLDEEARDPGDAVQGSDGYPPTGEP